MGEPVIIFFISVKHNKENKKVTPYNCNDTINMYTIVFQRFVTLQSMKMHADLLVA